ncbi:MAG: hypothetical protein LBC74_04470, partial [Planctomycetaceae bacterium]|nr:hypothetical protein [Planctomycetaceae bacterium]
MNNSPPKEVNNSPPKEVNNSPPSEGSGVVSYRLAKRSTLNFLHFRLLTYRKVVCYALELRNL